jgi:hypothetical protein
MNEPSRGSLASLSLSRRFHLAGAVIAVVGLAAAAWVWATAVDLPEHFVSLQRLKVEQRQLEIIGGKFAVEAARFSAWFDGLWVGRNLAGTLAAITVVAALACLWLGNIAARDPIDDDHDPRP